MKGKLIIIGGHEDKEDEELILKEVVKPVLRGGRLTVMTVATQLPEEVGREYETLFKDLGARDVVVLDIRTREDAHDPSCVELLDKAKVIFITGGDQLRITSQIGDSPVFQRIHQLYKDGALVAGTSAGAAVMPKTMLVSGASEESSHISALGMAPGLGLIDGVVIDSHFAERGRIGRLLGAVAQNPANLGLGIDENTAIIVEKNQHFQVIGSGAVYVIDGSTITYSSLSEEKPEGILSIFDVRAHILGEGDCFDLRARKPITAEVMPGD
jgi:cyanophycinase